MLRDTFCDYLYWYVNLWSCPYKTKTKHKSNIHIQNRTSLCVFFILMVCGLHCELDNLMTTFQRRLDVRIIYQNKTFKRDKTRAATNWIDGMRNRWYQSCDVSNGNYCISASHVDIVEQLFVESTTFLENYNFYLNKLNNAYKL